MDCKKLKQDFKVILNAKEELAVILNLKEKDLKNGKRLKKELKERIKELEKKL